MEQEHKNKEGISLKGHVEIFTRNLKTGKTRKICEGHNVITDSADYLIAQWIAGMSRTTEITHCAIGTGSTAESASQTALVTEVYRTGIGSLHTGGASSRDVISETSFGSLEANGSTIYEAGLFTAASGGTMISRFKFASSVTKTVNIELIVKWTITCG